jgi:hypothetical protein
VLVEWLSRTWPAAADTHSWSLGWEFVLALVTLVLALATAWLAWTTRRMARAASDEVQGQTRPVVVPTDEPIQVGAEQVNPDQQGKPRYPDPGAVYGEARGSFYLTVRVRNIGAGPALNLEGVIARDRYPTNRIRALPQGEEAELGLNITLYNEGAHPFTGRITPLTVQYEDLAGRQFTTSFSWAFRGFGTEGPITAYLGLTSGKTPGGREGLSLTQEDLADPFRLARGRFWPEGYAIRKAWATITQVPQFGQLPFPAPLPFHTRVHSAWRELFPRRRAQRFQRMSWSARVYSATLEKPCPRHLPRLLRGPYRILRGCKWAWLTYVRSR